MKRIVAAALAFAIAVPAYADFNAIARAVDRQRGVKRVWIPFLGVARMLVRVVHPEGVHDVQLAIFEGAESLDPRKLRQLVESKIGPGFTPLVQAWSRRNGSWSFVYVRPSRDGELMEMLVFARDDEETVLVRVNVDPERIARHLGEPRSVARVARR